MAARILHFGNDPLAHVPVLQQAGYRIEECGTSAVKLVLTLREAIQEERLGAVVFTGNEAAISKPLLNVVRDIGLAPVILFEDTHPISGSGLYDLVVPARTAPADWLGRVEQIIAENRVARENFRQVSTKAESLREQSGIVATDLYSALERFRRECSAIESNRKNNHPTGRVSEHGQR